MRMAVYLFVFMIYKYVCCLMNVNKKLNVKIKFRFCIYLALQQFFQRAYFVILTVSHERSTLLGIHRRRTAQLVG